MSEVRKARSCYTTGKTPFRALGTPDRSSGEGGLAAPGWGGSWDPRHLPTLYADPELNIFERAQSQYSRGAYSRSGPHGQFIGHRNFDQVGSNIYMSWFSVLKRGEMSNKNGRSW